MVVFHHYVGYGGGPGLGPDHWGSAWGGPASNVFHRSSLIGAYLWTGVCLFFVISGFVICMSSWGRTLGNFFTSRVTRLYPAYWLAVIASTVVLTLWPVVRRPLGLNDVLMNLTMIQESMHITDVDAVYWTLWIELRFYILFALVVWKGVTYRKVVAFCLLWTVAGMAASTASWPALELFAMPQVSPFFVAGLAYYLMYRYRPNALLWAIVGFSWILSTRYVVVHQAEIAPALGRAVAPPTWPAVALVTLSYLVMAVVALGWASRIQWRWLTVAGSLTYPFYLLHEEIGWTAIRQFRHAIPPWPLVGLVTAGMLLAAWLVHRLVERPLSRLLKSGITRSLDQLRAAEPPSAPAPSVSPPSAPAPVPVPLGQPDLVGAGLPGLPGQGDRPAG